MAPRARLALRQSIAIDGSIFVSRGDRIVWLRTLPDWLIRLLFALRVVGGGL